jgi:Flp pilus assembly protein TadG
MQTLKNERGSVIVFVTLMIVVLLIMVGLGLDTGQLTYVRNQGQAAVDSAALAAVSGLPSRSATEVQNRAAAFNSTNNYVESPTNSIGTSNISYVKYDFTANTITNYAENINTANGVRVALEKATGSGITTPVFLTPLFNLFGIATAGTQDVNVSAVATIISKPALPIALWDNICPGGTNVNIQFQHPDPQDGVENSCWTTFLDCSSGAPDIKAGFQVAGSCSGSPINGEIAIGTPICQNKGEVNSVLQAAEKFFDTYPDRWWVVPVLEGTKNCAAKNPTKIKTWAKIKPSQIVTKGNPKYIRADVVCGDNIREELETSLCFSHRLVREPAKGY